MAAVNANALQAFRDLQTAGLPAGAAAGVVGNLIAESSVNPAIVGDRGTSHGIAQWHNQRWTNLLTWARAKGLDPAQLSTQLVYLVNEAKATGVWTKLAATTDPNTAAAVFMADYERPLSKDPSARQKLARDVYAAGTGSSALSSTSGGLGNSLGGTVNTGLGLNLNTSGVWDGVRNILIEGAFLALAGGIVAIGVSKTFQSQISSVIGAAAKVV